MRQLIFVMLWLGFITYAFILAPPDQPDTFDLIQRMSVGDWAGINASIIAIFNAMGIWPMVYACIVLIDGQGQRIAAWPFVIVSFAVGAFALLPYLALRHPNPEFAGPKTMLLRLVDSRWLGFLLLIGAISVLGLGILQGDWADFWQQWQTSRFIHVMTLDFGLLWLLFPALLQDDMTRRNLQQPWINIGVVALPLVGACLYLTLRPNLPAKGQDAGAPEEEKALV
jgi:hypothetical protein